MVAKKDKSHLYNVEAIKQAVSIFGSQSKLARLLDLNNNSVYGWVRGQSVPSPINCIAIERITQGKIKRGDILPDYDWEKLK